MAIMKITIKHLLVIDGFVNLLLGVLLLLFPFGVASLLAVPVPDTHFYPTILGAVIFGIGLAFLIEVDEVTPEQILTFLNRLTEGNKPYTKRIR